MAIFGISWGLPFAVGPILAGFVIDNFDPRWLWYIAGVIGLLAVFGFLALHRRTDREGSEIPPIAAHETV